MKEFPERVNISDQGISTLKDMLAKTYKQINDELVSASDFGIANRQAILSQIRDYLTELGVNADDFLQKEVTDFYHIGANDAVTQLQKIGANVPIATGFNQVHKEAIKAIYSDSASSFADAMQGVMRSSQRLVNQAVKKQITNDLASGMTRGATLRQAKTMIKGTLADNGLTALVDKGGRQWSLDDYAEMLYRTKMAEARNLGMVNRMAENGYDLVQVSAHGAIDVCGKWEGQILSTTGATKEYLGESVSTVDQAMEDGLFHPNCKHAINAIVPDLATEAYGYTGQTDENGNPIYEKGNINKRALESMANSDI